MKRSSPLFVKAGHALERVGLKITGTEAPTETFARNRSVMNLFEQRPAIANGTFVAPNATLIGHVALGSHSSVWYGTVMRADQNLIEVGIYSNIQDRVVINTVPELKSGFSASVDIGNYCSIGHGSILTSCVIENQASVGAGCVISEGCVLEIQSKLAPGSVLAPDTLVPAGQLWAGNPAVYIRHLEDDEKVALKKNAKAYSMLLRQHDDEFLPFGTTYQEAEKREL